MSPRIPVALLILIAAGSPEAQGCRCAPGLSERSAYKRAHAVVVAEVANVTAHASGNGSTAAIRVSKAWKAPVRREATVETSTTCAFDFQKSQKYVLYLFMSEGKGYYTSRCVGNELVSEAEKKLEWLRRNGTPSTVGNSLPE
jgi:hypothetical protein